MSKSLKLLDQLIEIAQIEDAYAQQERVRQGKSIQPGESFMVNKLKVLKDLIKEEFNAR